MKRCSSSTNKTKLYSANQIIPISYLQFELFKPKAETPLLQNQPFQNEQEVFSHTNPLSNLKQKLITNKSYIGGKGGDLYSRTRNCLYQKNSETVSSIYKPNNTHKIPLIQSKPIPKKSNLDKLILSLKNEINELTKNIRTIPSTPNFNHNINDYRSKSIIQQRSFLDKNNSNKMKQEIGDGDGDVEDNYYERRLEHLKQKNKERNINNNNKSNYINNNNSINSKKVIMNYNTYTPNINNNTNNFISGTLNNKDIGIPSKLHSPYNQNNSHNTSEISSLCNQREENFEIRALIEKNKSLEQNVSILELKLLTSNQKISELTDKNYKNEKDINDLALKNRILLDKEKELQDNYGIQPYSSKIILKEPQREDSNQSKLNELQLYINDLTAENKSLTNDIQRNNMMYNEDIKKYKLSNDNYINDIQSKDFAISQFIIDLQKVNQENSQLKTTIMELQNSNETQLKNINLVLSDKDKQIEELNKDIQSYIKKTDNDDNYIKEQHNQMRIKLGKAIEEKEQLVLALKNKENEHNKILEESKRENVNLIIELERLQKEYKTKEINESKEKRLNKDMLMKLQETNEKSFKENKTQSEIIIENKETLLLMTNDISNYKQELSKLKSKCDQLVKEHQLTIENVGKKTNDKYLILKQEYDELNSQLIEKDNEYTQSILLLKQEKDAIENRLNNIEKDNESLVHKEKETTKIIDEYKILKTHHENDIKELAKANEAIKDLNDNVKREITEKENEITQMKTYYSALATEKVSSNANNTKNTEKIQKQLDAITIQFDEYKTSHSHNQVEVDLIKEINNKQKEKIDVMINQQQKDNDIIIDLKEKNKQLEQQYEEAISQSELSKKKNNETIEVMTLNHNKELLNYKGIIDVRDSHEKQNKDEITSLQMQLSKLSKENDEKSQRLLIEQNEGQRSNDNFQLLQKEKEVLLCQIEEKSKREKELSMQIKQLNDNIIKTQEDCKINLIDFVRKDKEKDDQINKMHQTLQDLNKENEVLNEKLLLFSSEDLLALDSNSSTLELEEIDSLYKIISQCKDTILLMESNLQAKDKVNKEMENEIEQYKIINNKLLLSIEVLKAEVSPNNNTNKQSKDKTTERIAYENKSENVTDSEMVENLKMTIDNLRELVMEKEKQIAELLSTHKDKDNSIDRSYTKNVSMTLVDAERCEQFNKRIDDYKMQLQTEIQQNSLLKEEIKDLNRRILIIQSCEGKITNYEEFLQLWIISFDGYKPKNSEKKEAYYRIQQHLTGYDPSFNMDNDDNGEKKSFLSKIFK